MRTTRTREELVLALRKATGNSSYTVSNCGKRETIIAQLAKHGITLSQVPTLRELQRQGGATAPTAVEVSRSEIERMVTSVIEDLDMLKHINTPAASVDMAEIRKLVAAEVLAAKPQKIVLQETKSVKLNGHTHPLFEKVLRLVKAGVNVLLTGPAGCGKTTLAHHIAQALNREHGSLCLSGGVSESQLTGWLLPVGKANGAFEYVASEFVTLYEKGNSVFLLDEIDAADPNMLLTINAALANGALHVPQRHKNPHVKRGENCAIIAAANTYGTGNDIMYAGRNQLDAATLDRFYIVEMGYDAALEASITGTTAPAVTKWVPSDSSTEEQDLKVLTAWIGNLRNKVLQHKMRRVVSTRTFIKAMAARRAGVPVYEIKKDILSGWTRDEQIKVGEF